MGDVWAGLTAAQAAPAVARIDHRKTIVVTAGEGVARSFAGDLLFFLKEAGRGDVRVCALPEDDPPFLRVETKSREAEPARAAALEALADADAGSGAGTACVVVCPVSAALAAVPPREAFSAARFAVSTGQRLDPEELKRRLADAGYVREPYTESPGAFSVRGGILDVWPISAERPVRVEFAGDEVESLRVFDPDAQTTVGSVSEVQVSAAAATSGDSSGADDPSASGARRQTLLHWLGPQDRLIVVDPLRIERALELRETEAQEDFTALLEDGAAAPEEWDAFAKAEDWHRLVGGRDVLSVTPEGDGYVARQPAPLHGQMDLLAAELKGYLRKGYEATIVCASAERLERLRAFLEGEKLASDVRLAEGAISAGVDWESADGRPVRKVWLRDGDIFKTERRRRAGRGVRGKEKISAFTDIEKGDYVVHEVHGIGVFQGIHTKETYGSARDYLTIAYAAGDVLYIPVEQMDMVQRYIGAGEKRPRVSRLGTGDWSRTKARVRKEIEEYACELIRLAAERRLAPGYAFGPDTTWQKDFDDRFPWEPTPDQQRCFDAVRQDMEQPWPMDRLICGDVGYGKTEVALRAAFKCAQEGKQVCILVPTTILAAQHHRTFSERFADFPVTVEMLSRFQSAKKQSEIFAKIQSGEADIVIGTHMLLSKKTQFHDLGLLVIDEEQRFGVRHKERIRALRAGVDVLTLTATPIPRTLHMSLIGLKDMSLIEDPPEDRHPVRTYVSEEKDEVLAESLRRELDRGGQAFVVYNRVDGLERVAERIRAFVPDARVAVCHAKMNERMVEEIMLGFAEGDTDVLLSTTIVESGLDIPNVNTITILNADRLGLTQLYQLRGRVGRSARIAFCYLFYRRDKVLTEAAQKRLRTIREFTELGSGFKIAMKDLEIRGAGNLLGTSQHGHLASVGYEMYCKLLEDAAARLSAEGGGAAARGSGASGTSGIDDSLFSGAKIETAASAVIPSAYIEDEVVKLQAYKRIALIESEAELAEVLAELADRFGAVPAPVRNLCMVALVKRRADAAGVSEVAVERSRAVLTWEQPPADFAERVFRASDAAHALGARLETDVKSASPRLRLYYSAAAAEEGDEARLRETAALLAAL
ncbi:MAG: transcription-repair coupling factor [Clostridiales Family XIII bacterium]|jgi:transcription-repair coupling factor (superfamily II helicase)|nr:transcription-repair coupling factor [Clostridiales Family XIII bacterium]